MGLLAQHAYGKSDKIERGIADKSIDGVVLSPNAEIPDKLEDYISEKEADGIKLYLDPQFYLLAFEGSANIGRLNKYSYYIDDIVNKKYLSIPQNIQNVVKRVIDYQNSCGLKKIISPSVFFESFDSRMSQIALSMANESISYYGGNDLYISLCISESAFKNLEDVQDFLDIISLFDVKGFYVIIERNNYDNANFIDSDVMANIMYFLYNLSQINMYNVILGYEGQLGIPLYASGIESIAMGWYAKTRKFDRNNFYEKNGMRRPRKRYYSNKLFNSILLVPEVQLIQEQNKLGLVLSNTRYDSELYNDLGGSLWTDSISCLEYWMATKQHLEEMDKLELVEEKIEYMRRQIIKAQDIYSTLPEDLFDSKSKSSHLEMWDSGLLKFKEMVESI